MNNPSNVVYSHTRSQSISVTVKCHMAQMYKAPSDKGPVPSVGVWAEIQGVQCGPILSLASLRLVIAPKLI